MSERVIAQKSDLINIANAIRSATGSTANYNVPELADAVEEALRESSGANLMFQSKSVSATSFTQIVTPDEGYAGLSRVIVNKIYRAEEGVF